MFEKILSEKAINVIKSLSIGLDTFYLAGGTGLALQLGHRISEDLDFFSDQMFNNDAILSLISANKVFSSSMGTIHCEVESIQISFLYYVVPLIYPCITWNGIKIAHCKDIVAEKIKTISQRGAKKDFIDLYAILNTKYSIKEVCDMFKKRFKPSGINFYHVVKSLVYFEDADQEPLPKMLLTGKEWQWDNIKSFFIKNLNVFEKELSV